MGIEIDDLQSRPSGVGPQTKFCHYCGQTIASVAEICPKCGVRQFSPPSHVTSSESDSPSKVAACLLAIFLGLLGAHKFYLGQPLWGVFYLLMTVLLFWTMFVPLIFGVICLVEGLVYLTYSDGEFARKFGRRS